jgi:hypothetical protein
MDTVFAKGDFMESRQQMQHSNPIAVRSICPFNSGDGITLVLIFWSLNTTEKLY